MIKKYFKLNNNLADPKREKENYDPCGKYLLHLICLRCYVWDPIVTEVMTAVERLRRALP
jgi:hypothetical protein